jgi:hypothetical protein
MFGVANTEVLVQEFLAGTEYIVDTVSVEGRRHVCGVWEYEKNTTPGGQRVYDKDVLLPSDDPVVAELVGYVDTVLPALDIRWGPVHAEVIRTPAGPTLVELGARLNGNMNPGFHDTCLGANQAGLTALAYGRPGEFLDRYADRMYERRQPAVVHNTVSAQDGVVTGVDRAVVDEISALPSVALVVVRLAPGKRIRPTVDLMTSPLRVFLTSPDPAQLAADHRAIQGLKDRVYHVR